MNKKPTLYIQETGPFPQIAMIVLVEKGLERDIDFKIETIDIQNKPEDFLKISPTGKPPLLVVNDVFIFETNVIIEAIDELYGEKGEFQPQGTLSKFHNKSWIEFGLELHIDTFNMIMEKDKTIFDTKYKALHTNLKELEKALKFEPYFNGDKVCLIDFVYATLFQRQEIFERNFNFSIINDFPKLGKWSNTLLKRNSTHSTVPKELEQILMSWLMSLDLHVHTLGK